MSFFYEDADFISGMNRVYVTLKSYRIVILAFSLMDNHLHFVLYGDFDECNRFMHDYVRRTSRHIAITHGDNHKMDGVPKERTHRRYSLQRLGLSLVQRSALLQAPRPLGLPHLVGIKYGKAY